MTTNGEQDTGQSSTRRRLLAGAALWTAGFGTRAFGQKLATNTSLSAMVDPAGRTTIAFRVDGEAENRVVFSSTRCTGRIEAVSLLAPSGEQVWRKPAAELGFVARDTTSHPELGDMLTAVPEIRDARRGDWRLVFEATNSTEHQGRILVAYTVLPRFQLMLQRVQRNGVAGQQLMFAVRAFDYGKPVTGVKDLVVVAKNMSGSVVASAPAVEFSKSGDKLSVSQEPGTYISSLAIDTAGSYRIEASHAFAGSSVPQLRTAKLDAVVGRSEGSVELISMKPRKGKTGCTGEFILEFAVDAAVAGKYVCSVTLQGGDVNLPRASSSVDLEQGKGKVAVVVTNEMLHKVRQPWNLLSRAVLMRLTPTELLVVAEKRDIDLTPFGRTQVPVCG